MVEKTKNQDQNQTRKAELQAQAAGQGQDLVQVVQMIEQQWGFSRHQTRTLGSGPVEVLCLL